MKLALGMALGNKGLLTPTQIIVNAFKIRVLAAGGNFEAKACLNAQLVILNNIQ